jgi:hypothetical protein
VQRRKSQPERKIRKTKHTNKILLNATKYFRMHGESNKKGAEAPSLNIEKSVG